jgi:hypothetical protein
MIPIHEIQNLIAKKTVFITSGEGEGNGTIEKFTGTRTLRAIKMRLARERCNGDRWADAKVWLHDSEFQGVYIDVETGHRCFGPQSMLSEEINESAEKKNAQLESAFSEAMGAINYQRLLDEKWLPFQGESHLKLSNKEAVAREVAAATEFLSELDGETAAELATPRSSTAP